MDGFTSNHSIEDLELDIADSCTCVCVWVGWVCGLVCVRGGEGVSDINVLQQISFVYPS